MVLPMQSLGWLKDEAVISAIEIPTAVARLQSKWCHRQITSQLSTRTVLDSGKATNSSGRECRGVLVARLADGQGSKSATKWALVSSCTAPCVLSC